jgi:hypothetical protein
VGLEVSDASLVGFWELDGRRFSEEVTFENVATLRRPDIVAVAELLHLLAGLSYYKAGAPLHVDLGSTPVGEKGRALLASALLDGLGEFSFRNSLSLENVAVTCGVAASTHVPAIDPSRVLVPFGGGIDSVVTLTPLDHLERSLFIVSPSTGRFAPLEATAAVSNLDVVRASRRLDPQILRGDDNFFNGHVPVTAMVTLLAVIGALATGQGAVAMSNEHSASAPNLR